jgi:3-hydroxyisobutyrate dehydrogenase-like beta-hydroxyacid dehydrogenase
MLRHRPIRSGGIQDDLAVGVQHSPRVSVSAKQPHPAGFMGKMAALDLTLAGHIENMLEDLEAAQRFSIELRTPMPLTGLVTELPA